ncbi:MAG: PhoU domain-containing protein [Planctomycetota bacterium]|nr:PhoU domain-containing protein [Planctomycetota bacterium]
MLSDFTEAVLELERAVILLGEMIEKDVVNVMMACIEGSDQIAEEVVKFDDEMDRLDESITWMTQEIFAHFNPKGGDLRFLLGVPRASSHLELIGDQCVIIGKALKSLRGDRISILDNMNLIPQFETVIGMTNTSINALIDRSAKRAWRAMSSLETAQKIREAHYRFLTGEKTEDYDRATLLSLFQIVNALYVMANNASDVAASVVYITHGVDVRYQRNRILDNMPKKKKKKKRPDPGHRSSTN